VTTFFLLPPRALSVDRLAAIVDEWFPGLEHPTAAADELADFLAGLAERHGSACVIFRDDLPEGSASDDILRDAFGAEEGDRIVEVRIGRGAGFRTLSPSPFAPPAGTMTAEDGPQRAAWAATTLPA
jgi:hypothetical protein